MKTRTQKLTTQLQPLPNNLREAWMALAGLSAVFLFEMLDNSILTVALPTIGRDLHSSPLSLGWVTNGYSVVFGGLMLLFGSLADRFGRRKMMLIGLSLLAASSLYTAFVTTTGELIAVRMLMGLAAAMTTPLSMALAFRLFQEDSLRLRAMSIISTVGLVGLAVGPTIGGVILAIAPWQILLLMNVPIAILAFIGIRKGINKDQPEDLHREPVDFAGAVFGTITVILALITPTLFVDKGMHAWEPWVATIVVIFTATAFILREHTAAHPLMDWNLIKLPLVSSGLLYKAATGLVIAGLGYTVTLQLQLDYGWPPLLAAIGFLPQVVTLLALGPFVNKFVEKVGFNKAAWLSSVAVILGLAVYTVFNGNGYFWVAVSLILVAAGIRVNGLVAGTNVYKGLPANRTSIGSALVDTSSEVASSLGIAVTSILLATVFVGNFTAGHWSIYQANQFHESVTLSSLILTVAAGLLVAWGMVCAYRSKAAN